MKLKENEYWHFAKIKDGQPVMRNGKLIEIGKTYRVIKNKLCEYGFHGSKNILDALKYAPGEWLSIRKITGNVLIGDDKVCGKKCVHVIGFDATDILREFARKCALDDIHLWDAPAIVKEYLETGKDELRAAAYSAAYSAACSAAYSAAYSAAWKKQNDILTKMVNKKLEGHNGNG